MAQVGNSPVAAAFKYIQWDPLSSLRLTPQETALLRMAETNPIEYTLGDARDATMYVRVLLKLLVEASFNVSGNVARIVEVCNENRALDALDADPLGVVTHYAIAKIYTILTTLSSPWATENCVSVGNVFYAGMEGDLIEQWKSLLRVISKGKGDAYAQRTSAYCLAQILVAACPSQRSRSSSAAGDVTHVPSYASAIEPLEALTAWIISQLKSSNAATVGTSIPAIMTLMGATEGRQIFAASGGIKYLARQLRQREKKKTSNSVPSSSGEEHNNKATSSSVQQLYELTFCLWCLTYELDFEDVRADFSKDGLPVLALVELVSSAPREKVVRVALAALRNLATCEQKKVFLGEMIACGLIKAIELLRERQFTDPDIVEDVELLHKLLGDNFKEMTRFEVWKNEVETGQLQWGSTHTAAFFKENAKMMEGKDADFNLVKILIALIASKDENVAMIACFDLGEFCRHYPNGRMIAKRLGAKDVAMSLIEHDNPELQRHALTAVSKMMVNNWEHVK